MSGRPPGSGATFRRHEHRLRRSHALPRIALVLALLLTCAPPPFAHGYGTRHVVIVVIDGGRYTETLGDSSLANEPRQGLLMAPLGCTGVSWNNGITNTVPGHAAILSGTYQPLANDGTERPHLPTLFEYYRAATGAPASQTWFFADKVKLSIMSNSDHPDYGDALAAQVNVDCPSDIGVVTAAEAQLTIDRPAILAMNLAETDLIAHSGDWLGYLRALQVADSLVYDLWTKIEADTGLAGRTTLFVTNDHGRHDDAHGGFQNHGDGCTGCRRVQMLALGPDFKTGWVSTAAFQPVDIVPTVGVMLGIDVPYATGQVMDDLLLVPHGPLGVGDEPAPERLRFAAPIPNPARGAVSLSLDVPAAGDLIVDVVDAQGRRVVTLEQGDTRPGRRTIAWSGRTGAGRRAAPGAYFVRARMAGRQAATRVVLR
jgi:hypothetical protein